MSDTTLETFVELPGLLATFRQEVVAGGAGWGATIDDLLKEWSRTRVETAIGEVDALLAAGLSEHDLGKRLWALGAEAFPDRTPVATLHDLRSHLAAKL